MSPTILAEAPDERVEMDGTALQSDGGADDLEEQPPVEAGESEAQEVSAGGSNSTSTRD